MSTTVLNAVECTVTFVDAAAEPAPEEEFTGVISWWIRRGPRWLDMDGENIAPLYRSDGRVDMDSVIATSQEPADFVTTGVYTITVTPLVAGPFTVKAAAMVGGVWQAVPATQVEVER